MQINKRDLITITALVLIFFSIAAWNVGLVQPPTTSWQSTESQGFYIDLGEVQPVDTIYFWTKRGNATVTVHDWSSENWVHVGQFNADALGGWRHITYHTDTQYLYFDIQPVTYDDRPNFWWSVSNPSDEEPQPLIEITEIAILSQSNQQIPIIDIIFENDTESLFNLIDEQHLVETPPTYMSYMYFDEVYFVRAAQDYLTNNTPFERTHPPLGKLIQTTGLALFGDTMFGWRIMGVIFATLMIPVVYLMGKKLFGTWIGGFTPAFLLTFDFLHFSMARMGTVDTYVVFFSLLSQLFFLIYFMNVVKKGWKTSVLPLFFAVIFFTLGFSTKWIVLYGAIGMLTLLAAIRFRDIIKLKCSLSAKYVALFNHPFLLIIGFIGVVAALYFATYIPDMLLGNSFSDIIKLQFEMYGFHSASSAVHGSWGVAWGSPWWSWPFSLTPLWLSGSDIPNSTMYSTIMAMGNIAVWWVGFICVIFVAERAIRGKELVHNAILFIQKRFSKPSPSDTAEGTFVTSSDSDSPINDNFNLEQDSPPAKSKPVTRNWDLAAIFIATLFFFQWLPYTLISRITYIYHFYISVPFLCLASAYFINKIWNKKYGKIVTIAYLAAVVGMFILFYAVISGMPAERSWLESLKLLGDTWIRP